MVLHFQKFIFLFKKLKCVPLYLETQNKISFNGRMIKMNILDLKNKGRFIEFLC